MDNFDLKKYLVENKVTTQSSLNEANNKQRIEKVKVGEVLIVSPHHSLSDLRPIYGIVTNIIWRTRTSALVHLKFCDVDGNITGGETVMALSKLIRINNL
jgi:hypothetical protein